MDVLLDEDAGAGLAHLPGVEVDAEQGADDGALEVGVGEDDVGRLAAELQGDLLDVSGGGLHHLFAHLCGAGEGDLVHQVRGGQACAGVLTGAADDVHHARRAAGLVEDAAQLEGCAGGIGGGLYDDGAAHGQGGCYLPGGEEQGEVPGGDDAYDAHGLLQD